jgi:DNA-binding CsgD family transcriptional regulator
MASLADGLLVRLLLDQAANRAADEVQLGLVDRVMLADFATPVAPDRLDDLAARLDPVVARLQNSGSGILRVNVIGHDGTILYSDLVASRGRKLPVSDRPELETALNGGTGADETSLNGEENADLRSTHARALEVYVPVRLQDTVAGAYEIYEDDGPVRVARTLVWGTLVCAWCVLGLGAFAFRRRKRLEPRQEVTSMSHAGLSDEPLSVAVQQDCRVRLTRREVEVLHLMATSHGNREIAEQLCVSQETVRTHVKRILRKLDQPNRTQAVVVALRDGLLDMPSPSGDN